MSSPVSGPVSGPVSSPVPGLPRKGHLRRTNRLRIPHHAHNLPALSRAVQRILTARGLDRPLVLPPHFPVYYAGPGMRVPLGARHPAAAVQRGRASSRRPDGHRGGGFEAPFGANAGADGLRFAFETPSARKSRTNVQFEWPIDWPAAGPIDLDIHDLPHASSQTEWWYVNAHMVAGDSRRFSVFAAFFRAVTGYDEATGAPQYGHSLTWAMTDWSQGRYLTESRVDPTADRHGLAHLDRGDGSSDPRLNRAFRECFEKGSVPLPDRKFVGDVFVGQQRLELDYEGNTFRKTDDGDYLVSVHGFNGSFGAELRFSPQKQPVRHGEDGVVKSPDGADMFYYFIPRCDVSGQLHIDGQRVPVAQGSGWYDHEFGRHRSNPDASVETATPDAPPGLTKQRIAWDWLALQLGDGRELTAYRLVDRDTGETVDQRAVLIDADGQRSDFAEFRLEPTRYWRSKRTFNEFPVDWRLDLPALELECTLLGVIDDQEFVALISKTTFWEGVMRAEGTVAGAPLQGTGYIERSGFLTVDSLDDFFGAVGIEVRDSVSNVLPLDPNAEQQSDLIASRGFEHLLEGVDVPTFVRTVIEPIRMIVDRGGKSWRSYAALACCDIVGGDSRQYVRWLALPELIHVGSMIVDDVQDASTVRRGGPPVHHVYGDALAINAGTAAYFLAQKLLRGDNISPRNQLRLYDMYFLALRGGHAGQALDIAGFDAAVEQAVISGDSSRLEACILAANRLKTAVPAASLARMGAIVGGGNEDQIEGLGQFFEALGLAFQVVDDLLNLRGFRGDLKNRGEDLTAGKVTLPVAKAFSRLDPDERRSLWDTIQSHPSDPVVLSDTIDLLEGCGALGACDAEAREMVEQAWRRLDPLVEDSMPKIMLRAFGWYVLDRHY